MIEQNCRNYAACLRMTVSTRVNLRPESRFSPIADVILQQRVRDRVEIPIPFFCSLPQSIVSLCPALGESSPVGTCPNPDSRYRDEYYRRQDEVDAVGEHWAERMRVWAVPTCLREISSGKYGERHCREMSEEWRPHEGHEEEERIW